MTNKCFTFILFLSLSTSIVAATVSQEINDLNDVIKKYNIEMNVNLDELKDTVSTSNRVRTSSALRALSKGIKDNISSLKDGDVTDRIVAVSKILEGISVVLPPSIGAVGSAIFGIFSDIIQSAPHKPSQIKVFQEMINEQTDTLLNAFDIQTDEIKNEISAYWGVQWNARLKGVIGKAQIHLFNEDYLGSHAPLSKDKLLLIQQGINERFQIFEEFKTIIDFWSRKLQERTSENNAWRDSVIGDGFGEYIANDQKAQWYIHNFFGEKVDKFLNTPRYLLWWEQKKTFDKIKKGREDFMDYWGELHHKYFGVWDPRIARASRDLTEKFEKPFEELISSYCLLSLVHNAIAQKVSLLLIVDDRYPNSDNNGYFNAVHSKLLADYEWLKKLEFARYWNVLQKLFDCHIDAGNALHCAIWPFDSKMKNLFGMNGVEHIMDGQVLRQYTASQYIFHSMFAKYNQDSKMNDEVQYYGENRDREEL